MTAGPGGYGFPSPAGGPPPMGGSSDAAGRVATPAILMIVFASIAMLYCLVTLAFYLFGVGLGALSSSGAEQQVANLFSGAIGVGFSVLSLVFNGVVLFGAVQMKRLENHTFAVVAAALFSIPCSVCCLANTPIGIWALVTLLDANVKAAFRS